MKKFIFLFISLAMFASCSDDDSSDTDNSDGTEIVGKWFLVDVRFGGTQNTLSSCNQQSFIQFNADKSAKSEFYEETEGDCSLEDDNEGQWQYLGNSRYEIYVPNYGNQTGTVNFTSSTQFIFTSPELPGVEIVFEK